MRTRTAAASAAVVLLTLLGSAACSTSADGASPSSETGRAARSEPAFDPSACAGPADEIPAECEVHPSFAATHEAVPAEGMPTPAP
ncbi:hypothetical protein FKN01_25120 [Streptomyces sp. 130]|uniref:hypothetical protein n=1 Tax=Streptomyces sp. 130 TaxID=2591006 RepID=UPI00117D8C21|nr:hypothetical protein [Streptomyces sp. 130]TRV74275.1 hypothetical protein FKN01_25120 [Streptomyces sp. 130]